MDSYPPAAFHEIKLVCPNCLTTNVLPIVFYSAENYKLAEEGNYD